MKSVTRDARLGGTLYTPGGDESFGRPKRRLTLTTSPDELELVPGQPEALTLHVTNHGREIDQCTATVDGIEPHWYTPRAPIVRLLPGETGTVDITICPPLPPVGLAAPAGDYPLTIKVSSYVDPTAAVTAQVHLHVLAIAGLVHGGLEATLTPQKLTTKGGARLRYALVNKGNLTQLVDLAAVDDRNGLRATLSEDRLSIIPGEMRAVTLDLAPRRRKVWSRPERYTFHVWVTPAGDDTAEPLLGTKGELTYRPPLWFIPEFFGRLSKFSVALLIMGAVLMLLVWFIAPSMTASLTAGPDATATAARAAGLTVSGTPLAASGTAADDQLGPGPGSGTPDDSDLAGLGPAPGGTPPPPVATATLTATPTPSPTPTPAATATPEPTATPVPLPEVAAFEVLPAPDAPSAYDLRWDVGGADTVLLREVRRDGTVVTVSEDAAGSFRIPGAVGAATSHVFELEASSGGGTVTRPIALVVMPAPTATVTPAAIPTATPTPIPPSTPTVTRTATPVPAPSATSTSTSTPAPTAAANSSPSPSPSSRPA